MAIKAGFAKKQAQGMAKLGGGLGDGIAGSLYLSRLSPAGDVEWARAFPGNAMIDELLEDGANEMNGLARMTLRRAQAQWRELDEHLAWCDERLAEGLAPRGM